MTTTDYYILPGVFLMVLAFIVWLIVYCKTYACPVKCERCINECTFWCTVNRNKCCQPRTNVSSPSSFNHSVNQQPNNSYEYYELE